ncbi:MAG: hypothetical protein HZC36_04205 [Armatimonadetes bacterium]|nr:hypothetical protein [Armatimonadota bacterium]
MKGTLIGRHALWAIPAALLWGCGSGDDIAQTAAMLDAERDAARKEGIPVEPTDALPDGKTPDAENAAITYLKSPEVMKEARSVLMLDEPLDELIFSRSATQVQQESFRAVLAKLEPFLAEVEAASRKPKVDYRRNWELGAHVLIPEMAPLKRVVRLLCARALIRSRGGDLTGAKSDLETAFRVSAHIGQEGLLIGYLVQITAQGFVQEAAVQIAKEKPESVPALKMAADVLARCPKEPDLLRALRGEASGGIMIARTAKSLDEIRALSSGEDPPETPTIPLSKAMRDAAEVRLLQFWRKVLPLIAEHPDDFQAAEDILRRETTIFEAHQEASYLLPRVCLPLSEVCATSKGRARASTRVDRALVFAIGEKRKTGFWPKTLPAELNDPFSDGPLRFRASKNSFKVWSVGPNGKDDGGDRRSVAKPNADDVAMSYP